MVTKNTSELEDAREMTRMALEQPIVQESDLGQVMKTLNEDKLERDTGFPSIS